MKKMQELKNELLQKNKNILKALHELYNFDFNNDFIIQKYSGRFTLNSVKKCLNGQNIDNLNVVVIITDRKYQGDRLDVARVYDDGFAISFPKRVYYYGVDDFWAKNRFEEIRKENEKTFYVLYQDKTLEKKASEKKPDFSERFKVKYKIGWGDGRGKHGISRITLEDPMHNNKNVEYECIKPSSSEDINYFIDKSGYIVEPKKLKMLEEAETLKRKRKKNAVNSIDFSGKIEDFENKIKGIKSKLNNILLNVADFDSACDFYKTFSNFKYLLLYVDSFKKANREKNFSSIEAAEMKIKEINEKFEKIENVINNNRSF